MPVGDVLRSAGDLTGPVGYPGWYLVVALVLPALVVGWYLGITLATRPPESSGPGRLRRQHLKRLAVLEKAVQEGRTRPRDAHREVGAVVRSYLSATGPVDVRALTLEQLRTGAEVPPAVVELVAATYPPAFRPGEPEDESLAVALADARTLIRSGSS